jgi:FMN phosphatase YigB (HAD superfamily)
MKIKIIIFDFDGTLVDSENKFHEIFSKIYSKRKKLDYETVKKSRIETEKKVKSMKFESSDEFFNSFNAEFLKKLNVEPNEQEIKGILDCVKEMKIKFRENVKLFKNVKNTIKKLNQEYKLVILSGSFESKFKKIKLKRDFEKRKRIKGILEKNKISEYIDNIFICSEYGLSKPDKEAFDLVLNKYNVKPEECIMIGDGEVDMYSKKYGFKTVLFNKNKEKIKNSDFCINDYSKLPEIIKRIEQKQIN